ncbi:hypothetical protein HID58_033815, partial [Brassica napus]
IISNFWTIKEKQSHSFAIKKLLRVRDLAYPWIKIKIRDGRSTRFWTDNWSSFGNIRELLRLPSSSALGIRPTSTLHDIHRNGVWLIPAPRSDVQVEIHAFLTTITLNIDEDSDHAQNLSESLRCTTLGLKETAGFTDDATALRTLSRSWRRQ